MKAIDSNLLVYASLAHHPAMTACEHDPALAGVFHSATQALSRLA
jgi:hypothetical protein